MIDDSVTIIDESGTMRLCLYIRIITYPYVAIKSKMYKAFNNIGGYQVLCYRFCSREYTNNL